MGGVPRLDLTAIGIDLNDPGVFALAMIVLCIVIWLLLELVVSSPFGRTLAAIRQNPRRVAALGGRVFLYRLAAFTASGAIAALAGALKVQHINFISPDLVSWFVSGDVLIAVVIGGSGRWSAARSARRCSSCSRSCCRPHSGTGISSSA